MATDPTVSRAKFARELQQFQEQRKLYDERGIWMLKAEYPDIVVAFATPNSRQVFVPFAAHIDFTDYDARPLTVTLIHPFTRTRLKMSEILPQLVPNVPYNPPLRIARFRLDPKLAVPVPDSIVQGHDEQDPEPFLCLPGVRSYHDHPAHTGDSWWLHKAKGEGRMLTIINALWKYGVRDVVGQQLTLQVVPAGYVVNPQVEQQNHMVAVQPGQPIPDARSQIPADVVHQ